MMKITKLRIHDRVQRAGGEASPGWSNAPTESGFGSFKNQRVYGERFETRE